MDKLNFKTKDGVDVNLEKLSQLFPEVITEIKDESGKIRRVADFEKLKMILGDDAAESVQEFYEFTWPGKNEAIMEAAKSTTKTLRPCPEESKNWDSTQNLYIEGDNLEVLKLLQESYLGKVKMIYIDPPYNTGKDFVYRDNFHKSAEEGKEDETARDEETGKKLFQNTESNGHFHSDWCSMIYPRLKLSRDFLSDDGVIFISIDGNELHNLKKICDEIFGESNYIETFSWVKTATPPALSIKVRKTNEYILCYEKNKNNINYDGEPLDGGDQPLLNTGNPIRELLFPKEKVKFTSNKMQNIKISSGNYDRIYIPRDFDVVDGFATSDFFLRGEFKWTQETLNDEISKGTTFVVKSDKFAIRFIRSEDGFKRPKNFITEKYTSPLINKPDNGVGTNENATSEIEILFGKKVFSFPKPTSLICYLINFIVKPNNNDLILDFFSGSSTSADSIIQLNAKDGGNRRFIMVQLQEDLDKTLKDATTESKPIIQNAIQFLDSINRPHNICELAKERIRRAGDKIKAEHATTAPNLDIGFRVLKLAESNMKDVYYSPNETSQDLLSALESNIKEDRTALDLLFACLIDWGVELSLPLKTETIDGVEVHTVNDGDTPDLIACFAQNIPEAVIRKIAARHPLRAVFRDSSFADSPSKINVTEIFKTFSPNTTIKVL
ncbi:MAG: site-specific DNA-methyltransferase [Opitutales bacterium]|nr:site-specific DNA-methyltransferase [Opitutales bacterium]